MAEHPEFLTHPAIQHRTNSMHGQSQRKGEVKFWRMAGFERAGMNMSLCSVQQDRLLKWMTVKLFNIPTKPKDHAPSLYNVVLRGFLRGHPSEKRTPVRPVFRKARVIT
jgi:hypothetical protein